MMLRLLEYLVNSLWMTPLVFAAAWLAARLVRRGSPEVAHRIWVSALLLEVVLPAIRLQPAAMWHGFQSLLQWFNQAKVGQAGISVSAGPGFVSGSLMVPAYWRPVFATLYGSVVLYFAARLGWGVWTTHRIERRAQKASLSDADQRVWQRCCVHFQLEEARVAISQEIGGPVTVGLRRAVLLLPPSFFERVDKNDIDAVMAHECAHMQRCDFMKNLLYRIVSLPTAYHPLLWLTLARIAESREMICDAMAASVVDGKQSYARSLLRLAATMTIVPTARTLHAIGIFDANAFERRVMRLTEKSVEIGRGLRLASAAACMALGVATCASALALHTEIAASGSAVMDKKEAPSAVHVSSKVIAGLAIYQPKPVYPEDAKKAGIEGAVVLKAIISKNGTVDNLQVVSGPEELRESALDAVREWRYKPYLLNGESTAVETTVTVTYSLAQ